MIEIQDTLVSQSLLEEQFICDLKACKGICCIEGDAGAPLEAQEIAILDENLEAIKPFLNEQGLRAIAQQGMSIAIRSENTIEKKEYETPLLEPGGACVYAIEDQGVYGCGIEKAYAAGAITWQKPISCHLYPVRLTQTPTHTLVNYETWNICNAACELGQSLKTPVYKFLKQPLIRRFGTAWYEELELVAAVLEQQG